MTMSKALQNLYKAITGESNSKVNISKLLVDIHYAITGKETAVKNNRTKIINSMATNWPSGGGGGGGGDSLIKTANVKVNYTLPEGVDEVTFYNFQQLTIRNSNNDPFVQNITYSDTLFPLTELGTPEMLKIPICENGLTNITGLGFSNGDDYLYVDSWSVVSGDASADEYNLDVYGDCEVNMTLAINES